MVERCISADESLRMIVVVRFIFSSDIQLELRAFNESTIQSAKRSCEAAFTTSGGGWHFKILKKQN